MQKVKNELPVYIVPFKPCYFIGAAGPGLEKISQERSAASDQSGVGNTCVVHNPNRNLSIEQQRQKLPVFEVILITSYVITKLHNLMLLCMKSYFSLIFVDFV